MSSTVMIVGVIVLSFLWLDRTLASWKKEQDAKFDNIHDALDDIRQKLN